MALWRTQVADDVLRELIYTNREFTGSEAKLLGFATHVADDPLTKAMELAAAIADKNPHAIRGAKRLCNLLADANDAQILQAERDEQVKVIRKPNQVEAVMAHMQKRKTNLGRKSVVKGKSGLGRVDLGAQGIMKENRYQVLEEKDLGVI